VVQKRVDLRHEEKIKVDQREILCHPAIGNMGEGVTTGVCVCEREYFTAQARVPNKKCSAIVPTKLTWKRDSKRSAEQV